MIIVKRDGSVEIKSDDSEKIDEIDQTLLGVIQSLDHMAGVGSQRLNRMDKKHDNQRHLVGVMSNKLQYQAKTIKAQQARVLELEKCADGLKFVIKMLVKKIGPDFEQHVFEEKKRHQEE